MGRYPDKSLDVDITLEHDGQVIHCNTPDGMKAAKAYLKEVTA